MSKKLYYQREASDMTIQNPKSGMHISSQRTITIMAPWSGATKIIPWNVKSKRLLYRVQHMLCPIVMSLGNHGDYVANFLIEFEIRPNRQEK